MTENSSLIRVIGGSKTDKGNINTFLGVLAKVGAPYKVSYASCHRDSGGETRAFENFIAGIKEGIIVFIGGMSIAAPGLIESLDRNAKDLEKIVFAVPTDKAALSAVQDLPRGTAIITSGLNQVKLEHSIINSALAVAKLSAMLGASDVHIGLLSWYKDFADDNPLVPEVELGENGLIP